MTKSTLNTALPMMVPKPTLLFAMKTPMRDVKSSGADPPAAMNVAPATSSSISYLSHKTSSAGTKKSSQIIAIAMNVYRTPTTWSMKKPLLFWLSLNRSGG